MTEKSKALVKLIIRATAVGLQAKFDANLAKHGSASYIYGRTHTSRMHLRWLFNVRNSLQVLHARLKMNAAVSPQENLQLLISNLLKIPRTKSKQTNTFFITLRWEA